MIVDKINTYLNTKGSTLSDALLSEVGSLAEAAFLRQFGEQGERERKLRLSSIGNCMRQQAYKILGFPENGKEIDARAKMVFFMGDLTELAVVALAKAAGCEISNTGLDQLEVTVDGVTGHPDGIYHEPLPDGDCTDYLFEVKSMSSFAFKEFENGIIQDGYRYQCNSYMKALELKGTIIVGLNKDAGVLGEQIIHQDQTIIEDVGKRIKTLKVVTKDTLPERPYAPNDKGFLPWNCLYCPFWGTCWPDAQKVLVSGKYKLVIQKGVPGYV